MGMLYEYDEEEEEVDEDEELDEENGEDLDD